MPDVQCDRARKSTGLALVEVLVAVGVVALALIPFLGAIDRVSDSNYRLRDKSMAHWVAANKMAELRLAHRINGQVLNGEAGGEVDMAQRSWRWRAIAVDTPVDNLKQIQVSVFAQREGDDRRDEQDPLITLVELQEQ